MDGTVGALSSAFKRRHPFKAAPDDENVLSDVDGEQRILDEQEQEELIQRLKQEDERLNRLSILALRGIVILAALIQDSFFLAVLRGDPRTGAPWLQYFVNEPGPLIPLASLFALASLVIIGLCFPIKPDSPAPVVSHLHLSAASVVAPTICLLLRQDVSQTIWWSVAGLITGISWLVCFEGEGAEGLEKLKYPYKGA